MVPRRPPAEMAAMTTATSPTAWSITVRITATVLMTDAFAFALAPFPRIVFTRIPDIRVVVVVVVIVVVDISVVIDVGAMDAKVSRG